MNIDLGLRFSGLVILSTARSVPCAARTNRVLRPAPDDKAIASVFQGEGRVPFQNLNRVFAVGLLLFSGWAATGPRQAWGQEELTRKVKTRIAPAYPELARHLNLSGVVKIRITVAPNGTVKDVTLVGGHPLLANAALDAVKKWRYEAAPQESSGTIAIYFAPNH